MTAPLLNIETLSKSYGGLKAIDSVNLSVKRGQLIGLIGGNGAGKSTLMKCITGAEKPDQGEIKLEGVSMPSGRPDIAIRSGITMMYQNLNLCPNLNVVENIFLGQEEKRLGSILNESRMRQKSKAILDKLSLDLPLDRPVQTFSGGQQQAIALARALISEPKVLILDEPTAALGMKESELVLNVIEKLKKDGLTILLISHRLNDVFRLADRIVLMQEGRITLNKPTAQLSQDSLKEKLLEVS